MDQLGSRHLHQPVLVFDATIQMYFIKNFSNCANVKITRQIDFVLYYLAYEWCNLTNFLSEIAI